MDTLCNRLASAFTQDCDEKSPYGVTIVGAYNW